MASTTLFAPQVASTQPAFIYTSDVASGSHGTITVEYTPSELNISSQIKYVLYSIKDPNQMAGWGSNLMFKQDANATTTELLRQGGKYTNATTGKTYILIQLVKDQFKVFTKNQFYQIQLYFVDQSVTSLPAVIDSSWLDTYKNYISEPSQVTLVRPISSPVITSTTPVSGYDYPEVTGYLADDQEAFDSYYCTIQKIGSSSTWTSPVIQGNGKNFKISTKNSSMTEGNDKYKITLYYTTLHGYSSSFVIDEDFQLLAPETNDAVGTISATFSESDGGVKIVLTTGSMLKNSKIQRKETESLEWKTIYLHTTAAEGSFSCIDTTVESGKDYQYRLLIPSGSKMLVNGTKSVTGLFFDDIFLSDETGMVAIRLNPSISSFKYVTQESITNTLGGKYPIIRKNGDTKYCQFSLSGMIDCEVYEDAISGLTSSTSNTFSSATNPWWFNNTNSGSLYLADSSRLSLSPTDANLANKIKKDRIERDIRRLTMDFLTNGNPKLFRSFEEGNMIVYLSGISFTPNKSAGRHIYDFSATVTEMCEYTSENLSKYKLNKSNYTHIKRIKGGS
jgi:hypothetical protein